MRPRTADRLRFVLSSVFLMLVAVTLGGCGGVAGTYAHEAKAPDGTVISVTLELKSDGKEIASMKGGSSGDAAITAEGTYTVEGDKVTVTLSGDKRVYTLKDGDLTIKAMGEEMVLKKK